MTNQTKLPKSTFGKETLSLSDKKEINEGARTEADVGVVSADIVGSRIPFKLREAEKSLKQAEKQHHDSALLVASSNAELSKNIDNLKSKSEARKAAKSAVSEIRDQLLSVNKVVGDVEVKAMQLERIAAAMKVISDISKDKIVMSALSSLSNCKL